MSGTRHGQNRWHAAHWRKAWDKRFGPASPLRYAAREALAAFRRALEEQSSKQPGEDEQWPPG